MLLVQCAWIVCLMYLSKRELHVDANEFCNFIELCLLPQLLPFDGYNPRSVVVMDNASIHHVYYAATHVVLSKKWER